MNKKHYIISGSILLLVAFAIFSSAYITKQSAYPDDYQYQRTAFKLFKDYSLSATLNTVDLGDGIDRTHIVDAYVTERGCNREGEASEKFTYGGNSQDIKFGDCDQLTYSDMGGKAEYIHYQSVKIPLDYKAEQKVLINIVSSPDVDVIERTLTVVMYVECSRDAHCVESAPVCDLKTYKCVTADYDSSRINAGTDAKNVTTEKGVSNFVVGLIGLLVGAGLASAYLIFVWRRGKR